MEESARPDPLAAERLQQGPQQRGRALGRVDGHVGSLQKFRWRLIAAHRDPGRADPAGGQLVKGTPPGDPQTHGEQLGGVGYTGVAPATRELVDTQARRIIEECYNQALETLRGNQDRLDRLARTHFQKETLDEDEAYAAAGVSRHTVPAAVARSQAQ